MLVMARWQAAVSDLEVDVCELSTVGMMAYSATMMMKKPSGVVVNGILVVTVISRR